LLQALPPRASQQRKPDLFAENAPDASFFDDEPLFEETDLFSLPESPPASVFGRTGDAPVAATAPPPRHADGWRPQRLSMCERP
jgi:hypothetical protein